MAELDSQCLNNGLRTILGLDVGGSKIAVVEGTANARILQRRQMATEPYRSFDQTLPELARLLRKLIEASATVAT